MYIYIILIYNNKNNSCTILHILHSPSYILLIFNLLCLYVNKTKRQNSIDNKLLIAKLQINHYNPSCDLKNYVLHSLDIKFSFFPNRSESRKSREHKISEDLRHNYTVHHNFSVTRYSYIKKRIYNSDQTTFTWRTRQGQFLLSSDWSRLLLRLWLISLTNVCLRKRFSLIFFNLQSDIHRFIQLFSLFYVYRFWLKILCLDKMSINFYYINIEIIVK